MPDGGCCLTEAGNPTGERLAQKFQSPFPAINACPACGIKGKSVPGQTVKALLSASLRAVQDGEYLFCMTQSCPVVYFSPNREQTFTVGQVRERVYQKEPNCHEVFICYCFRHTVGDIRTASPAGSAAIVEDIHRGIHAGQCACDVRNPQGSCCLGNVKALSKGMRASEIEVATPTSNLGTINKNP